MWTREIGLWFLVANDHKGRRWAWEQPSELLEHESSTVRRFAHWMRERSGAPSRLDYQRMAAGIREYWVDLWLKRDTPSPDTAAKFGGLSTIRAGVLSALETHVPELE